MGIFGAILKGVGIGVGASVVGDLISNYCDKRAERKAEESRIAEEKAEQARLAAQIRWEKEKAAPEDGLSDNIKTLIEFVKHVPEEKVDLILRVMKSILEDDR